MLVLTALAASVLLLSTVDAQRLGPPAFLSMVSAAADGVIYYHGGQLNIAATAFTGELWGLDVNAPWSISSPAWTNYTVLGSPRVGEHSAVMSQDLSNLIITNPAGDSSPFLFIYNLKSKSWSSVLAPAEEAPKWASRKDVYLVTDTKTGIVWMVGGVVGNQATSSVDKFDPTTGKWTPNTLPASANPPLDAYSTGTAHFYNGRIYIFGGFESTAGTRAYQSFQKLPYVDVSGSTPVAGAQYTLGAVPPSRQDHCSVLTKSDKVIIFGGYASNTQETLLDMWVLDLVTWTWKEVIPKVQPKPRRQMTCNIVGANMVVFGGRGKELTGYANDVQVYDVMQSTWVDSYVPKDDLTPRSQAPSSSGGGSSGLSTGALVGIIAGILIVVFAIFSVVFFKRRQRRIEIREAELEKEAYLASLRPEPSGSASGGGGAGHQPGLHSPADSRMAFTNNEVGSPAYYTDAQGSPLPAATPGVQYLMQHLPDGTIAVQPVYIDASALSAGGPAVSPQAEPATSDYISPSAVLNSQQQPGSPDRNYVSPPVSVSTPAAAVTKSTNVGGYPVAYPTPTAYGQESAQDPFASPVLGHSHTHQPSSGTPSPRPPAPPSVGSPQHIHPEAHYGHPR